MAIYGNGRIANELHHLFANKKPEQVTIYDLLEFDQMHYDGIAALDVAVEKCQIKEHQHIVDIGSGYGGPSRYLAWKYNVNVTAIELQEEHSNQANELTKYVQLGSKVRHLNADISALDTREYNEKFHVAISLLVFLHIPNRDQLLKNVSSILKLSIGKLFIEDWYCKYPFLPEEVKCLSEKMLCPYLPTKDEYIEQLISAGFGDIEFIDMTESWTTICSKRSEDFYLNREIEIQKHGQSVYEDLLSFYQGVDKLFKNGHLGGARIVATKLH
ncbi:unnamed protein product [Didymodactylos carnosus]|uniref:phosphoethanolamine N-methyltransferase n=1 Tax=Didymodactylos carnosus TaxID=1234261 RepID=A0A8S2IBA8_9BILA|nr:unnamed protein product [Didymodactylos carnosus]CAF3716403.1 unnamed protein product [Didymodactylos carnosus]